MKKQWLNCSATERDMRTAPRGDLNVVVGPTTTQERRGWTNDDKRGQGRASRQAHVAQKSQGPQPGGREAPDDHGSGGGGAWRDKCENLDAVDQAARLVLERAADL